VNPLIAVEKPSEKTLKFINELELNTSMQAARTITRLQIIPTISLENELGKNFSDLSLTEIEKNFFIQMPECSLVNGGPLSVADSIALYYLYDAVIEYEAIESATKPLVFIAEKRQLGLIAKKYPDDVCGIVLPFNISQNELVDWIQQNWASIQKLVGELPKFKPAYLPQNLEIGEEITKLKDQGQTFEEISNYLSEKYPDDSRMFDANQIKLIYHRHHEYLSESEQSLKRLLIMERILNHTPTDVTD